MSYHLISKTSKDTKSDDEKETMGWKLCALCRTEKKEKLKCTASSKRKDISAGYKYIAGNIQEVIDIDALPFPIKVSHMNNGSGMANTFLNNKAAWYPSFITNSAMNI